MKPTSKLVIYVIAAGCFLSIPLGSRLAAQSTTAAGAPRVQTENRKRYMFHVYLVGHPAPVAFRAASYAGQTHADEPKRYDFYSGIAGDPNPIVASFPQDKVLGIVRIDDEA